MRDGEDGGLGDEFGVWRRMRETLFSLAQISKRMALVGFSFRAVSSARLVPSAVVECVVESWAVAGVLGAQEGVAASLLVHSAVSSAQDSGASFPLCLRPLLRLGRPPGNWALGTRDAVRLFGNIRGAAVAGMHGWSNRAKPPRPGWESGCWEGSWRLITGRETPASRSFSVVVLMNQCLTKSSTTRFSSAGLGELDEAPILAASSGDEHIPPSAFIHRPECFVRPSTTPGLCMSLEKRPIRTSINKQFCR
jgi:hypothetical protein